MIRHCLGRLAKFKVPQSVAFVDVLPRNATGKVLKRELRTQFVGTAAPAISLRSFRRGGIGASQRRRRVSDVARHMALQRERSIPRHLRTWAACPSD